MANCGEELLSNDSAVVFNRAVNTQHTSTFATPRKIDVFSLMSDGTIQLSDVNKRYLRHDWKALLGDCSRHNMDLNQGRATRVPPSYVQPTTLENIFTWFKLANRSTVTDSDGLKAAFHDADVVCAHGLLGRIALTPYEERDSWTFSASEHEGIMFLWEDRVHKELDATDKATKERLECFGYYSDKFEQLMTADEELGTPDPAEPVDSNKRLYHVLTANIGAHKLLYAGRVDAYDAQNNEYIELKTHSIDIKPHQKWKKDKLLRKMTKWWVHIRLAGMDKVIYGKISHSGVLQTLTKSTNQHLQTTAQHLWSGAKCLDFVGGVLSEVRQALHERQAYASSDKREGHVDTVVLRVDWSIQKQELQFTQLDLQEKAFLKNEYFD